MSRRGRIRHAAEIMAAQFFGKCRRSRAMTVCWLTAKCATSRRSSRHGELDARSRGCARCAQAMELGLRTECSMMHGPMLSAPSERIASTLSRQWWGYGRADNMASNASATPGCEPSAEYCHREPVRIAAAVVAFVMCPPPGEVGSCLMRARSVADKRDRLSRAIRLVGQFRRLESKPVRQM